MFMGATLWRWTAKGKRRAAFCALFAFAAILPLRAMSEPVTFVALASVKPGAQAQYDEFIRKVTPIWNANGMQVLARLQVTVAPDDALFATLTEIAVIHAESREGFRAYIGSAGYAAIKHLRLDAVDHLTVLEGDLLRRDGEPYLANAPLARITLSGNESDVDRPALMQRVTLFGPVKGERSAFVEGVRQVTVVPVTYEDAPSDPASAGEQTFIARVLKEGDGG